MNRIVKEIMERDGESFHDAQEMLEEARQRVRDGDDPQDVLEEEFSLEPDFTEDLLDGL